MRTPPDEKHRDHIHQRRAQSCDPAGDGLTDTAAENELKEIGEEAAKADAPAKSAPSTKKKATAKKSVVVEADSDFEEFSPEDLD